MNTPNVPEPEEVVRQHLPLLKLLVGALQLGIKHAHDYADWQDEAIDRSLAHSLVRKGAKRFLTASGQSVQDEEVEFEAEYLPNLGLALNADGVRIRILKSDNNGNLPVPGASRVRQRFYAQQQPTLPFDGATENDLSRNASMVNLVLHWGTDDEYNLSRVSLACPKAGDTTRFSVQAHWDEPIWRRQSAQIAETQIEASVDDLEIYIDAEEETGTDEE